MSAKKLELRKEEGKKHLGPEFNSMHPNATIVAVAVRAQYVGTTF